MVSPRTATLILALLALCGLGYIAMTAAHAQQAKCAPRDVILAAAERSYGETPVAWGLMGEVAVYELLLSATGSWTIIGTRPDGVSCVLGSGEDWETTGEPKPPGEDS